MNKKITVSAVAAVAVIALTSIGLRHTGLIGGASILNAFLPDPTYTPVYEKPQKSGGFTKITNKGKITKKPTEKEEKQPENIAPPLAAIKPEPKITPPPIQITKTPKIVKTPVKKPTTTVKYDNIWLDSQKTAIFTAKNAGEYGKALKIYEDLAAKGLATPTFYRTAFYLAIDVMHDTFKAKALAKKLTDLWPQSADAWNYAGWVAVAEKDIANADIYLSTAFKLNPNYPAVYLNLGDLAILDNNREAAKSNWKLAIKLDTNNSVSKIAQQRLTTLENKYN